MHEFKENSCYKKRTGLPSVESGRANNETHPIQSWTGMRNTTLKFKLSDNMGGKSYESG